MFQTQLEICNCQQQSEVFFRFGVLSVFFFFQELRYQLGKSFTRKKGRNKKKRELTDLSVVFPVRMALALALVRGKDLM